MRLNHRLLLHELLNLLMLKLLIHLWVPAWFLTCYMQSLNNLNPLRRSAGLALCLMLLLLHHIPDLDMLSIVVMEGSTVLT